MPMPMPMPMPIPMPTPMPTPKPMMLNAKCKMPNVKCPTPNAIALPFPFSGMELIEVNGRDVTDLPFDDITAQVFKTHYFATAESETKAVLRLRFRAAGLPPVGSPANANANANANSSPNSKSNHHHHHHHQPMVKLAEFEEFVGLCSVLGPLASAQEKAAFVARLVDEDNDGYVSYENAFALLKALLGTRLSDAQLEQATLSFLANCGLAEEDMLDGGQPHRDLTDREFSIWHVRQKNRGQLPKDLQLCNHSGDPRTRSRIRVPRYVLERLLINDASVQSRLMLHFYMRKF